MYDGVLRIGSDESLFRSLRPDFIETNLFRIRVFDDDVVIVPVSKAGLH